MPGSCISHSLYLLTGLTWFNVFGKAAPLYMAGLAFHSLRHSLFAMSYRDISISSASRMAGWDSFPFLSILGADVFSACRNIP